MHGLVACLHLRLLRHRLAQRVCPLYRQSGSLQCFKSNDVVQTSLGEHYIMSKSWAVWGVGLHVWSRCSVCPRIHCRPSTLYVIHGEYTLVLLYTTSHTMSWSSRVSRLAFCRDFISCPTIPHGIPTDCPSLNNFWIALEIPSGKGCQEEHYLERPSNSFLCMYLCLTYGPTMGVQVKLTLLHIDCINSMQLALSVCQPSNIY